MGGVALSRPSMIGIVFRRVLPNRAERKRGGGLQLLFFIKHNEN
jgi:hypothetical protein